MAQHNEVVFEEELCQALVANGWLYSQDDTGYDKERAIYPADVFGWLHDTQPTSLAKVVKPSADEAERVMQEKMLLDRLCKVLDHPANHAESGMLSVLRNGFKNVSTRLEMCQFKPAMGLNPATLDRYSKVRLRVMRQVHYSTSNNNSIDLVFFINGLPVATMELKTDFTQSVKEAIMQYKTDRLPRDPKTKKEEPLLSFGRRALVHFAVSNFEVLMTTRLMGEATHFLPFNLGDNGRKGNPLPGPGQSATSYMWEQVLQRDAWLNIIGRFLHLHVEEKSDPVTGESEIRQSLLFPRYHQWDVVTRLVELAKAEGPGHKYLIQHSAGSGKTNSIAWAAHQLSSLHNSADEKVFDSVIVITDRTVLDDQLQNAIYQIEHKSGVVARITSTGGSKSAQLSEALVDRTPIIIVTIQTFPFALKAIREGKGLAGRQFAVIADEAHSSQAGSTANTVKEILTQEELADFNDGGEIDVQTLLTAEMTSRAEAKNISYFAFTATPKAKTLELFGRKGPDGLPHPFHLYSMQQAIEEGFILDVLKNYTSYRLAYKLAHNGQDYDSEDTKVEQTAAVKSLIKWVKLHQYNISQKVEVIVEHFRTSVAGRLDGKAKAMVVTGSRKEAVRYKIAMDQYLAEHGYNELSALVAFSGEVSDPESSHVLPHGDKFTELNMNHGLKGRSLPEAFSTDDYQVMLVANKFQTGFDQPLLMAMYVDKKLSGVTAVQTLSRLNRTAAGKDQTFVLDFVNKPEEILAAFQPYFREATISHPSDPNVVHDLQAKLDATLLYEESEIEGLVLDFLKEKGNNALAHWVAPAKSRFNVRYQEALASHDKAKQAELEMFRKDLASFIRAYDFLSQIVDYGDTGLEKRSIYYKHLAPVLSTGDNTSSIDLTDVVLTKYSLKPGNVENLVLGGEDVDLQPLTAAGTGVKKDPKLAHLSEIIEQVNALFEGEDLTEVDTIAFVGHIRGKLSENETLRQQAQANTPQQFAASPDLHNALTDAVISAMDNHAKMSLQTLEKVDLQKALLKAILPLLYQELQ